MVVWCGCSCSCSCLSICLSVCLPACLSVCKFENEGIRRDFLNFRSWQHQKRNNSARLPQCSKLRTSKTKQFCETAFKNGKCSAKLTASHLYQCVLRFFHSIWIWRLPRKSDARSYEVLHVSRKIILDAPKCNPSQDVSCPAPATRNASFQILFKCPTPTNAFETATKPSRFAHFWQGAESLAPATQNHIWTFKCGPSMFFFTFWLGNMLRATTACTFSTFPKVVRTWCFVHFDFQTCFAPQRRATCRRSSRQLAPHPPRRFSEPTFRPSGATNHWKEHSVSQLFYIVAHLHLVSSHSFSSLIFSLLLFSSLTLPTFAFPSLHIVGSLTFKLPSVRYDIGYKLCHFLSLLFITSSIARGGGGSFENRKPIGDVGCCESRMAERTHWWSERWLVLWIWSGYNGCSCRHLTHNCWM